MGWTKSQKYSESSKIDADFHCSATTRSAMDKWRLQADSAHQTGLDTTLEEVLTAVQSSGGVGRQKYSGSSKITADFHCSATTKGQMDK
jgi:hypothetical protein